MGIKEKKYGKIEIGREDKDIWDISCLVSSPTTLQRGDELSPDDYQKKETVVLAVGATLTNRGAWYNEKKVRKKER